MGQFSEEGRGYYGASRGVAGAGLGLGIAGTALGVLNSGGLLGGMFGRNNGWGWNNGCGCNNGYGYGYNQDLAVMDQLAQRDAEIARLNAEKYSDQSGLALYKYFDGKLEAINQRLCDQAVLNERMSGNMSVLASQLNEQKTLLASITQTAIPERVICDFNGRGCCTTVTQ